MTSNPSELVIAIDFGTTFSGVAFAHTGVVSVADRNVTRVAESVEVVKNWPHPNHQYAEKTPTIIAYTNPPTWGGSVKPQHKPQVAKFKLGLEAKVAEHFKDRSTYGFHRDLPRKTAVDFTADYLKCLLKFVQENVLPRRFGEQFLLHQQLSYVVTVPAIWTDLAKHLTKEAALRAGVRGSDKLVLLSEPEAAALYCATACEEVDLKDGDFFLVCDAGGGTVDLISYKLLSLVPFETEESSVGTGALCGSICLNEGFEALLKRKLGRDATKILTQDSLAEPMRNFEHSIKRQFNPYDRDCEEEYQIHLSGRPPDIPAAGLEAGYMKLTRAEIQGIFNPVFEKIQLLINGQIQAVKTKHKAQIKIIFLVGGFASNEYLLQYLQKNLKPRISIRKPMFEYSAIMRGAVLHGLGLNQIRERLMRRSYGVATNPGFITNRHPENRKFVDVDGVTRCRDVMEWFTCKGEKIATDSVVKHTFMVNYPPNIYEHKQSPLHYNLILFVCEDDAAAVYKNGSVYQLCNVKVNLRQLPPFQKLTGAKGVFYQAKYQLGLAFKGSELEFKFLYEDRVVGSTTAKFA